MTWNRKRTTLSDWGAAPTLIEPVTGKLTLRNMAPLQRIEILPLDGAGKPAGQPQAGRNVDGDFTFELAAELATTWYLIRIRR
ncbi:MAG: hypothetical protein ACYTAO_18130 [Planctomycetota bacterium]|jgi:hypothetical protein